MGEKPRSLPKKTSVIIAVLILLGFLLIYIGGESKKISDKESSDDLSLANNYRAELERISASMCTQIKGVESAKVNITFDGGMTSVYAKNSEGSMGGTYFSSGGSPLFLKYEYPKVVGCVVVCTGDVGDTTRLELTEMMSAYLGISSAKIFIGYKE